jgi:diguanylate cyclase (GGDEF)-like protein
MSLNSNDDTIEAQTLPTSLDPYGQLVKLLLPRALSIAIYDRSGVPLWMSEGCEESDLLPVAEEALSAARAKTAPSSDFHGFDTLINGDPAYIFLLRDGKTELIGAVAVSCRDPGSSNSRPFSFTQGLLRPSLEVLTRELVNQYNIGDLQRSLHDRDGDLQLLVNASEDTHEASADEFEHLIQHCVGHLHCAIGSLLIPAKNINLACSLDGQFSDADGQFLERMQRHLLALTQVQRRTVTLNKAPGAATQPYKVMACPIIEGGHHVVGILLLCKARAEPDFDLRQTRLIELVSRRIAFLLQNTYDPATCLLTRTAFEKSALASLGNSPRHNQYVAYADVDRMHVINENHGMHVGDEVLARVAQVIREALSPGVLAARISGDRFALFMPDTTAKGAEQFLATICRNIGANAFAHEGKKIEISTSFGLATIPDAKYPLSHALATAEAACKAAKDRGRSRVEVYQEEDRSIVQRFEDVALIGTIRDALANDRFRLEAQPIVAFAGGKECRRFELLLRMIDERGESVAPDKFFTAAERYQLATPIDRWVVEFVLEILSSVAQPLEKLGAHFAVNLSGQSLGDEGFPQYLERKLIEYALPPSLLSFELTETAAVANIVRAETLIRRLQDLGHEIALDDFGRGLSSLTYLKSLPVSHLKIDGGLIRDLAGNSRTQATVTAIVQLARAMKMGTTAECVETEAIHAAVAPLGVDYGQGFAIGRPRSLEIVLQEVLRGATIARIAGSPLMARLAG